MARRTFEFGSGGKFIPLDRDGDEERLQWRAVDRLGGEAELIIERTDGTFRNLGTVDLDEFDSPDDLYDYIDDVIDGDNDSGYYGEWSGSVSVVSR